MFIFNSHPASHSVIKKILVVDDDVIPATCFSFSLNAEGYEAKETDGSNIDEIISDWTPDVLLTDLDMPKQTGFELAKALKNKYPELVCLAFTGLNAIEMLEFDHHQIFLNIFQKPMSFEDFRQTLAFLEQEKLEKPYFSSN